MRKLAVLFLAATALFAQQPVALMNSISQHAARLGPMLQQVRAKDWVAKGASDTYATQLASAQQQIDAVQATMGALAQHPDHMQDCMKALFQVQAFHRLLDSLMGGLRKYQNPALADLIQSVAAEDQSDLDKLQQYILLLVSEKEQEYKVIDNEAQRCRALLSAQPTAPARTTRK